MESTPHLVIVGGGFGGLQAARSLHNATIRITLIDRRNFHLFQPLLYQVAVGELSPANIATPFRSILKHQKNVSILMGEVSGFNLATRTVRLQDGESIPFDSLLLAAGSRHHYFGHEAWEKEAPGLKTIEDATEIRSRIMRAFESAEREKNPEEQKAFLTFVVVGGGATGVELAGALADVAHENARQNFNAVKEERVRIFIVETEERLLPPFAPKISTITAEKLNALGVEVRTGTSVADVSEGFVTLKNKVGKSERVATKTILWAAGVQASPLGKLLADAAGCPLSKGGKIPVEPNLSVPGHPTIFVIGDMAQYLDKKGNPLPAVAPVAMQQGRYVADTLKRRISGGPALAPFLYRDRGSMVTVGRASAVADLGWAQFNSAAAWFAWLFIHLINLMMVENRLLVLIQWTWYYVTNSRSARLITGENAQIPTSPT